MEQLAVIAPVVVAALTGLTVFAYKHQKGYEKLSPWLVGIIFVVFFLCFTWNSCVGWTYAALLRDIPPEKYEDARKAADDVKLFADFKYVLIVGGVDFYLIFLRWGLPLLMLEDKQVEKDRENQN